MGAPVAPHLFVVFGATGDLFHRKLLPALHRQVQRGTIGEHVRILGVARKSELDDERFRAAAGESLAAAGGADPDGALGAFLQNMHYQAVTDGDAESYAALARRIAELEREHDLPGNRVFYLALPPQAFPTTVRGLGDAGLARSPGFTRIVLEKPFGRDLQSARELNELVHRWFSEEQVYRIDHYLGKETVQNLFVFRFANSLFEPVWNRDRVEHVQITVGEQLGVEGRAGYYDHAGAVRDMMQNHLTQLLCLTAMEPPAQFTAEALRNEKVKVLQSIAPIAEEDVVFGRYAAGSVAGEQVPAYRDEPGVGADSRTETFAAVRLSLSNWRWQGVPFYLRTGKRLARRLSRITVSFRCPPVSMFAPINTCSVSSNQLVISVQPDEGFDLVFEVKAPGDQFAMNSERMRYRYADAHGSLPDAYETLLRDIVEGDQTLFVRADEVERSWEIFTPLFERQRELHDYAAGSWGPAAADELIAREGRRWAQRDGTPR